VFPAAGPAEIDRRRYDAAMTTDLPVEGGADARGGGDQPDALAAAEAAVREGGDEATAICLRCFAPLDGAPTRCANCGAPASRAATLGPSAGGGVDVGGTTISTLPRGRDGSPTAWAYCMVWALGIWALPLLMSPVLIALAIVKRDSPDAWLWSDLAIRGAWTVLMAVLLVRSIARARRARSLASPPPTPDA
jgi:hypothetical protein